MIAARASPIPVFPEVHSMIVPPGLSLPSAQHLLPFEVPSYPFMFWLKYSTQNHTENPQRCIEFDHRVFQLRQNIIVRSLLYSCRKSKYLVLEKMRISSRLANEKSAEAEGGENLGLNLSSIATGCLLNCTHHNFFSNSPRLPI